MSMNVIALSLVAAMIAVGGWFVWHGASHDTPADFTDSISSTVDSEASIDSPFGVIDNSPLDDLVSASDPVPQRNPEPASTNSAAMPSWDSPLSEAQLSDIVARLHADPALLQQLIDEFRQETDPQRKRQLAMILGAVGGEQATLVASELIFSGDSDERSLGMDLLQTIQPGNAQAREIVSGMLATEVEPDVLVDAMTALSRPGDVDSDSRAFLSDQLAWLTTHEDDAVRSISFDILSRWSDDGRYTDTLLTGLGDTSEYVRGSAAYALAGHEDSSPEVIERLFGTVRSSAETESVKRAAVLALRSMPLSRTQIGELNALEKVLNTRR